ncbi:MAG TPA: hypothetical protein PLM00_05360 [Spirochaetota bacterium]|nr:hypothetical protein [Spirochaetota bacterium]HPN82798.1 hypothetical protein [Spirochaetota bacterium]
MSPLHGSFDSMFSPARLGELSESSRQIGNDLDSLNSRLDFAGSNTKQLAIMFRTLFQAAASRGLISDTEFRDRLDSVDLGKWTQSGENSGQ